MSETNVVTQKEIKAMKEDKVQKSLLSMNLLILKMMKSKLPEVLSDVPECVKTKSDGLNMNSLEDAEKRLIKWKVLNKLWLSNSDKIPANSDSILPPNFPTDIPSKSIAKMGSDMIVPEVDLEDTLSAETNTAQMENVFSTLEGGDEFNE